MLSLQTDHVAWGHPHGLLATSSLRARAQGSNSCPWNRRLVSVANFPGNPEFLGLVASSLVGPVWCQTQLADPRRGLMGSSKANRNLWMQWTLPTIPATPCLLLIPTFLHRKTVLSGLAQPCTTIPHPASLGQLQGGEEGLWRLWTRATMGLDLSV